jgi:hypothetical protein
MHVILIDFIKNAGLVTLFHLCITTIVLIGGVSFFLLARTRNAMRWFLLIGILPLLSGILTLFVKNRLLDTGKGMFAPLTAEDIAAGRREAWIDLGIGVVASLLILLLRAWRAHLQRPESLVV